MAVVTNTNTTSTMTEMTIWTEAGPVRACGGDDGEPLELDADGWPSVGYEAAGFAWRRINGRHYMSPAQGLHGIACQPGTEPSRESLAEILGEATIAEVEATIAGLDMLPSYVEAVRGGAAETPEYFCFLLGFALRQGRRATAGLG